MPVLLCRMVQGEIKSWLETEKIDRVCQAHALRHCISQSSFQRTQDKDSSAKTTTKGVSSQNQVHETKRLLYQLACAACWSKDGQ